MEYKIDLHVYRNDLHNMTHKSFDPRYLDGMIITNPIKEQEHTTPGEETHFM